MSREIVLQCPRLTVRRCAICYYRADPLRTAVFFGAQVRVGQTFSPHADVRVEASGNDDSEGGRLGTLGELRHKLQTSQNKEAVSSLLS